MLKTGIKEHARYMYTTNGTKKTGTTQNTAYAFERDLAQIHAYGYDCMDYQELVSTNTPLFEKNNKDFESYLSGQRKAAEGEGVEICQTHGPWRYPPQDATEEERAERFEKMSRAIVGTALLGCKNFVIHPIMPFGTQDAGHETETIEMNLDFMAKLCRVGRENGVTVCYENMPFPDLSVAAVSQIIDVAKQINDEYFKVCLDTGHCTMFGLSPADAVRMIGKDLLRTLHIHDNDGRNDLHWNPFNGVIDWEDFGAALYEIGYDGVISLETGVSAKVPAELIEYEEIGLFKKASYIAALASGKK